MPQELCFPGEIWLEVAKYLSDQCLPQLSLACKSLQFLVQPLLFRHVSFHPMLDQDKPDAECIEEITNYLEFLTQPRIINAIQACTVRPYRQPGQMYMAELPVMMVLQGFTRFPNLRSLTLRKIVLTGEVLATLRVLPLTTLEVLSCYEDGKNTGYEGGKESFEGENHSSLGHEKDMIIPEFENRLSLRKFIFDRNMPYSSSQLSGSALAVFLNPTTLQRLFAAQYRAASLLSALALSPRPFSSLTVLHIGIDVMIQPKKVILSAFAQCPSLTRLCLHQPVWDSTVYDIPLEALPLSVLPKLSEYEGPYTLASFFGKHHSLRHVSLKPSQPRSPKFDDPESICECLVGLRGSDLESLDIPGGTVMTEHLISTISTCFPYLKTLSINSYPFYTEPFSRPIQVKHALSTAVLPVGLESINLGVKIEDDDPRQNVLAYVKLCAKACDGLKIVRIRYGRYPLSRSIVWRRTAMLSGVSGGGGGGVGGGSAEREELQPELGHLRGEPITADGSTPCTGDNV